MSRFQTKGGLFPSKYGNGNKVTHVQIGAPLDPVVLPSNPRYVVDLLPRTGQLLGGLSLVNERRGSNSS